MSRTALVLGAGLGGLVAAETLRKLLPQVGMRGPNLKWHAGKILYEKYWLYRRF